VCRSGFRRRAHRRGRYVGEWEGLEGVVYRACYFGVVLGRDVKGEVEEGLAVSFDEGGKAGSYQSCLLHRGRLGRRTLYNLRSPALVILRLTPIPQLSTAQYNGRYS
jgi:hypothetical protein